MLIRQLSNGYIRVIAEKPNTNLKIGDILCKEITFENNTDTSQIEEVDLEVVTNGESE